MKLLKKVAKLSKKEKYLLTCSYGPDSMALFYYLLNKDIDFEVAHVNYHILDQADNDEAGIKEFANKYNIKVHVLSTFMPKGVNEEIWARDVRYEYFVKLAHELNIKNVLVAHNEGDNIETYFLQKKRGGVYLTYGLEKERKRDDIKIIRPLLDITKQDLEKYCIDNKIPYSIDPSNFDSKFQRNAIRKELAKLSKSEKEKILVEIKQKNLQNLTILSKYASLGLPKYINTKSELFKKMTNEEFQLMLIYLLKKKNIFVPISEGRVVNLREIINQNKATHQERINDEYFLSYDYGIIRIVKKTKKYEYRLGDLNSKNEVFSLNKDSEFLGLLKNKFPITIKPAIEGDSYRFNNMTLKVKREFISWKMPSYLREVWPGIFDKNGYLVYVPRYQSKAKKGGLLNFKIKQLLC